MILRFALGAALAAATASGASAADPGEAQYNAWICAACHGKDRAGKVNAPSLRGVAKNWTVDRLADYLADPPKYIESDPRLKAQDPKFPMRMPSFAAKPLEERKRLAEWLIKQSAAE